MADIAIIVAAGNGTRMNSEKSKLLLKIDEKTVIEQTVEVFENTKCFDEIIVVCRENDFEVMNELLASKNVSFVFGGKTRQESVMNAISTIDDDECDYVAIHDGARPLVTEEEIIATLQEAKISGAAATGTYVKDTIKTVNDNSFIIDTPERSHLIAIATPQIFDFSLYKKAAEMAKKQNLDFTDDCKLVENISQKVKVVIGKYSNIKITTPEDISIAQALLNIRGEEK